MNSDSQIISNPEIKSSLLTIYDKIGMIQSREIGYELFIDLILNNLYLSSTMNFIISQVGDFINSLSPKEKEPYLKLLSLFFYNPNNPNNDNNQSENGNNSILVVKENKDNQENFDIKDNNSQNGDEGRTSRNINIIYIFTY